MSRPITPGTILEGKYRLLGCVGEGGMGTVYEAEHVVTELRVAVKLLRRDLAQKPDVRARFDREVRAAGRVDHENVCEVLDSGATEDGSLFLVMPLLRGRSLKALIEEVGPLPFGRACDIALQILDALAVAHARGVIHRDLKPANVFLTQIAGRADFVRILDFGVTKLEDGPADGEDLASLTRTGAVLGTPCYMAPEQARGSKDITGQVDVYAVGVILYETLTGCRPIEGDSYNEILWKLWNAPIKPPSAHRPDISPELEAVVLRALSRSRGRRYPSAEAMRIDLAAAAHVDMPRSSRPEPARRIDTEARTISPDDADTPEPGLMAPAEPPAPPAPRPPRRHGTARVVAAAVAGFAVALVVGAAALGWFNASGGDGDGLAPDPVPASAASPPIPLSTKAGEGPRREAAPRVTITLEGVPAGAAITADGRAVAGPVFEVEAADGVGVAVRAEGFAPWEQRVAARADVTVAVRLERAAGPDGGIARPPRDGAGPRSTPRRFGPLETFGEVP